MTSAAQTSLYLRWRPKRFADLISQEAAARALRNAVMRGTVAHAYLFCGPRGTGKTSIARILYRALNCLRPVDGEPCGECHSCAAVDNGRAIDLIEMDAASHGGVDDVRELRERVYFAPVEAQTKVYIVDEAHQLSAKAWDAFLKTIEEPPPRTVFVLATTEAHKVPPTIISRCQRFDLHRHSQKATQEHLELVARSEGWEVEPGVADRLARLARGSLRDALAMLEQLAAFAGTPISMEAARRVLGLVRGDALRAYFDALSLGDARRAVQLLEDLTEEGADLRQFLDEVLFYLRRALLIRLGAGATVEGEMSPEEAEWLRSVAQRWAAGYIHSLLRAFGEIEGRGRDEQSVLVQLDLVTVWASGLSQGPGERTQVPEAQGGGADVLTSTLSQGEREQDPTPLPMGELGPSHRLGEGPAQPRQAALAVPPRPKTPPSPQTAPVRGEGASVSVAGLQARWPALRETVEANLLMRLLLQKLAPVGLDGGVVTLQGPIDRLELQRLDGPEVRRAVEAAFDAEFQAPLRVRFRGNESEGAGPNGDDASPPPLGGTVAPAGSIAELGVSLFGGQLVEAD